MFENLKDKTYNMESGESIGVVNSNESGCNSDYQICIETEHNGSLYVDDCKENWDVLMTLNNRTAGFLHFKDSSERDDGILGIRVNEIIAFYIEG